MRVIVNSTKDGVQPDAELTLREAISIVNGTLPMDKLSDAEKMQVSPGTERSRIEFNLMGDTTIRLTEELPPLATGMMIDGGTQPGYQGDRSVITELSLPAPIVAIAPAEGAFIFRGLTVAADDVTIRGLSLYGFTSNHQEPAINTPNTPTTPPADIFIAHRLPPADIRKQRIPANFAPFYPDDLPPKGTLIENNWLGIPPSADGTGRTTGIRSAFGVSVFNGTGTIIRRNWIADHEGSAIITSVKATELQVTENAILANGVAGMPDAIRLEGNVDQAQITGNVICGNDGSAVYLFKPDGAVQIRDNQIAYNGRRLRRAAVYLMGNNHQVTNNQVSYQAGPGVVVAAVPHSERAVITGNRFVGLEGLSIDLITQQNTNVLDYQVGDGLNPPRNNFFRRLETGNAAIAAPQFITRNFVALASADGQAQISPVQIYGKADPGSEIEIYRVTSAGGETSLTEPIAKAETDSKGEFTAALSGLKLGEQISAIATDPRYGTSEPAVPAQIQAIPTTTDSLLATPPSSAPRCVTLSPPPPEPPPVVPTPIVLKVPRNIHFALDKDFISPASARVLDRIAQVLQENPMVLVSIIGHTDPRATDAYNLALGARRAQNTRNYLLKKGIAAERITIRSEGERQPATPGRNKLDFARDRRAEFLYKDVRDIEIIIQEDDLQIER
ncbi:MAG: cell envelope biogenesis protein OmpA [Leptolyngbya sp.]|nr:MAG: cell envelope biogenesis protein OmpA [Leptolyngbya sp.]